MSQERIVKTFGQQHVLTRRQRRSVISAFLMGGKIESMLEQKRRIEELYGESRNAAAPVHFSVSTQRYPFTDDAFLEMLNHVADNHYQYTIKDTGMEEVIVGVVGTLQFDVFEYRMKNEYGVDLRMEGLPYEEIRLIDKYPGDLSDLNLGSDAELLEDYRGRNLLVFTSFWAIDFTCRRNPGLELSEIVVSEG